MTSFLEHLAARDRALLPVLRPRLAARFEPPSLDLTGPPDEWTPAAEDPSASQTPFGERPATDTGSSKPSGWTAGAPDARWTPADEASAERKAQFGDPSPAAGGNVALQSARAARPPSAEGEQLQRPGGDPDDKAAAVAWEWGAQGERPRAPSYSAMAAPGYEVAATSGMRAAARQSVPGCPQRQPGLDPGFGQQALGQAPAAEWSATDTHTAATYVGDDSGRLAPPPTLRRRAPLARALVSDALPWTTAESAPPPGALSRAEEPAEAEAVTRLPSYRRPGGRFETNPQSDGQQVQPGAPSVSEQTHGTLEAAALAQACDARAAAQATDASKPGSSLHATGLRTPTSRAAPRSGSGPPRDTARHSADRAVPGEDESDARPSRLAECLATSLASNALTDRARAQPAPISAELPDGLFTPERVPGTPEPGDPLVSLIGQPAERRDTPAPEQIAARSLPQRSATEPHVGDMTGMSAAPDLRARREGAREWAVRREQITGLEETGARLDGAVAAEHSPPVAREQTLKASEQTALPLGIRRPGPTAGSSQPADPLRGPGMRAPAAILAGLAGTRSAPPPGTLARVEELRPAGGQVRQQGERHVASAHEQRTEHSLPPHEGMAELPVEGQASARVAPAERVRPQPGGSGPRDMRPAYEQRPASAPDVPSPGARVPERDALVLMSRPAAPARGGSAEEARRLAPGPARPTIEVTIGRVEARAVSEPPTPTRRRPPAPALSLELYLRRRREGGA